MKLLKDYSEQELVNLKKGQLIMTNMLKEFDNICRNNGLKYWCVGGTLIGCVRHKGWIPHDGDIDVAMLKSDYEILQNIIQKELSNDYWFQDKSTDKYYKSHIGKIRYLYAHYDDYKCEDWHNGIQLDIFIFEENNNSLKAPYEGNGDIKSIMKNIIFPLKEMYFDDILVYIPNEFVQYCINFWGSYPPKELSLEQQYSHEGRISFSIPQWMIKKYDNLYSNNRISSIVDLNLLNINYKGYNLLFPKENTLSVPKEQVWVNFTGLTTKRPEIIFNKINSLININENMKILDIGCGCGEFAIEFYIKYKNTIKYTGIDIIDRIIKINQINIPNYSFINSKDFIISDNYDIIIIMGYGHNLTEYMKEIIKLKNVKYIILESHTGKNEYLQIYNNILNCNYNIMFSIILKCGDNWALKERHLIIYKSK